ncbi:hypothetical protein C1H46_032629 [Malus baccata]|uniref:RING-type E3 ubiquitin transferase n=1 Tax=Malus baccata TaxID=106549 RepID=A0A540L5Q9_MALBA|nr:hypothetical protein C1H46_032629 [Malus baccata]
MEIAPAPPPSADRDIPIDTGKTSSSQENEASAAAAAATTTLSSSASSVAVKYDDEEEEEDVCRICRNPGDADNPLRYPCACSGSIKFVHQDCLLQWLNHSNARQCEVCKHAFSFSPVYAENAPARLPFQEFVVGMAMKTCHVLQFFLRLSFVLSVWLLIIPFITFWIWRLAFVRSFGEAQRLFLSHLSTTVILTDCLHGFLLSASIVFIFLGATSLRDYFRHLRELGGQDADREDEGERNGARAARRAPGQANRNFVGDVNGEDAAGAQGIAGAGQMIRRNAENVAARWEMQAARLEAHVEQMFDGLDDADGAEDVPFDELVGMQGPVFHLVENAFTVLASNMIFLGVVIFVPFSIGRIILYHLFWIFSTATGPVLSTVMPLTESALSLANVTLKNAVTAVTNVSSESQQSGMVGQVEETLKANMSGLNEVSNNVSSPLSADFLKGATLGTSRLSDVTTLAVGYMFVFSLVFFYLGIVALIQYTRGESLTMGRDPADPNYNPFRDLIDDPVHKHARRVLLSVAVYGSLIVMLVFLPVKLAMRMAPSIFPLDISVSDPFTEIPADMLLFQICIPFAIEHFKLRTTIKSLLRYWFTAVGWALGLTDFLLPRPEDNDAQENGNAEPGRQDRVQVQLGVHDQALVALPGADDPNAGILASGDSIVTEEYDTDEQSDSERYSFVLRIVLLLVVAWMTLLVFNSALIVVPTSLGRAIFNVIPFLPITHGIKCNDLYAFIIGSYIIWTAVAGVRYSIEHIRTKRVAVLLGQIWKWCAIVIKSSALLSIWIFVIPVLIGLLFELLVIVPMRVPVDESPVFLLYQDWALGLIFLKIWTRLVMLDHMMPLVDETWRVKFERVREDGFSRLQGLWVLREIVFPIIMKLLTALCVPYVLARGLFPVLGYPLVVNSAVYRFAWLGCLCFSLLCFCAKRFHVWFTNLHNSIRDDRYLVGRRLHNFGEAIEEKQNEAGTSSEVQGSNFETNGQIRYDREVDIGLRLRHVNRVDA